MSRCFPYPPPGYLRQGLVDESIKLEREKVLPKTEHKLRKKRQEEKNKEKNGRDKTQGLTKKLKKLDEVFDGYRDDQIERSDITEEHGPPVCYTSDGTQNSYKRKREAVSSRECKVVGNKIKIRFSLKEPRVSDALISEEPVCSSSLKVESVREQSCTIASVPEQKLWRDELSLPELKAHYDGGRKEQSSSSSRRSAKDKKMPKAALQYKMLIEDWMPPLVQFEHNDDGDYGDDWLFSTKPLGKPVAKRTADNYVTCGASAALFSRAQFLSEAEIYALPYTIEEDMKQVEDFTEKVDATIIAENIGLKNVPQACSFTDTVTSTSSHSLKLMSNAKKVAFLSVKMPAPSTANPFDRPLKAVTSTMNPSALSPKETRSNGSDKAYAFYSLLTRGNLNYNLFG